MRAYYPHLPSRKKFVSKAPSMGLINVEEKANEEVIANTKARRDIIFPNSVLLVHFA